MQSDNEINLKPLQTIDCDGFFYDYSISRNCKEIKVSNNKEFILLNNNVIDNSKAKEVLPLNIIIPAVLVIAGWIIVYKTQANRERRKSLRDLVAGLFKDLHELEVEFIKYHTSDRDQALEYPLLAKLNRFEKSCNNIPNYFSSQWRIFVRAGNPKKVEIDLGILRGFKESLTLKHWMDEHTGKIERDNKVISDISISSEVLAERLEKIRIYILD